MKVNAEHGCATRVGERPHARSLTHSCCVYRQVIFIRPDTFVHDERYVHGSAVTPSVVDDAMRAGNTLLVHNLEIYWKPVGEGPCASNCAKPTAVASRAHLRLPAGVLSEHLSSFTNLYAQVNLYFSPPGFTSTVCPHQDAQVRAGSRCHLVLSATLRNVAARQSVFIMQLEGTKAWNLYAPKYQLALKKQLRGKAGDVVRREEMGDLLMQVHDSDP